MRAKQPALLLFLSAKVGHGESFDDHPIQRCFQDVHALTQQVQGRTAHFKAVGRAKLGLDPKSVFI